MKLQFRLAALTGLLLVFAVATADDTEAKFKRIQGKLVCQCGCSYLLSDCPHLECPSAIPMRKQIRAYLAQGMSEQEVIDAMVKQMGMVVLAAPPAKGFNLAAWVMPFVALGLGFFVVRRVLIRMRKRARLLTETSAAETESLKAYQQRLAGELSELERETAATEKPK